MRDVSEEVKQARKIHIRPARIGDVCLLFEPAKVEEIYQLRQRQAMLQSLYGGIPIERVHLTCFRFEYREEVMGNLISGLENDFRTIAPIALKALGIKMLYSSLQGTNIMRWRIEVSKTLEDFVETIERRVAASGIQPLYMTGFVSSLVTALKGTAELEQDDIDRYFEYPHHLFTGEKVVFSRIEGANKFEILTTINLGR